VISAEHRDRVQAFISAGAADGATLSLDGRGATVKGLEGGYWAVGFVASVVFAFPLGFGGRGVWFGLAFGLAFVAIAINWRFHRRERLLPNGGLPPL
jgi:Na+-driven multidrug efflux pump